LLLEVLHRRVQEVQHAGQGYVELEPEDFAEIGNDMGLNEVQATGLFNRLVAEGYLRLFHPSDTILGTVQQISWVEYLSDKGLIAIGALPDANVRLIAAFEAAIEKIGYENLDESEKRREINLGTHAIDFVKALAARGAGDAIFGNLPI
jgi:hypothetical protein